MPLYEFKCPECGHDQEEICKFEDKQKQICEKCGKLLVAKVSAARAIWHTDTGTVSNGRMTN